MEKKVKKLYLVSNAHLDTQWNWTIQDSIREYIYNTLVDNFNLIEKYPSYHMNFEGAFRYKLAKEYYPDLYEKLKQYIAEGRWSVAGSMWDACDTNVPSSEALMRQILYGNGFFEKEFGKRSLDVFLPDCFGFRYSLPSIAAHMGLIGFSTQKLQWGLDSPRLTGDGKSLKPLKEEDLPEADRKPKMDLGKWTGPDGSTIMVSLNPGSYVFDLDDNGKNTDLGKNKFWLDCIEFNEKHTGVPSHMRYYGTGDNGGSCKEISAQLLDEAMNNKDGDYYEIVSASTDQIFRDITPEEFENLPEYRGGLLIPHGYGTFTSRTINKRWNRKNELLADSAERSAVIASILSPYTYPHERLTEAWERFLWHQFHDDLTGTSYVSAYYFSLNDYIISLNEFASELKASSGSMAAAYLNTDCKGSPVVLYNPLSFERTDLVSVDISKPGHFKVVSPDGKTVPSQVHSENGKRRLVFTAKVPSVGYSVYDIRESEENESTFGELKITDRGIENSRYALKLNEDGDICSIIDKNDESRELLSAPVTFEIGPDSSTVWPSWELTYDDCLKPVKHLDENVTIEKYETGDAVVSLKVTKHFSSTVIEQIIRLCSGSDRIDVQCKCNWAEVASNLRLRLPLTVSNPVAEFDQGLGTAEEGNTSDPYYQYVVHQWADLTDKDGSYGVSLFNDCKYGMDKPDDNTLRLTLIHTPISNFYHDSWQNWQDIGENNFTFSIMGHKGKRSRETVCEAARLNQPVIPFFTDKHKGYTKEFSFMHLSDSCAIVRCIKKEEKGHRIIVRIQETLGEEVNGLTVSFMNNIRSVVETNGFEDEIGAVPFSGKSFSFDLNRYSVKTFAVELATDDVKDKCASSVIELAYDKKITTSRDDLKSGEISGGKSIPEELWIDSITASGINFKMGPADSLNALASSGQEITIPEGAQTISLLLASSDGNKVADFTLDDHKTSVTVQDIFENVGCWDLFTIGKSRIIKHDEIAHVFTHINDENGFVPYKFAYIFRVSFDARGKKVLKLPEDKNILVFAATASFRSNNFDYASPVYDGDGRDVKTAHTLRIEWLDGKITEDKMTEGELKFLVIDSIYDNGYLYEGMESDSIIKDSKCCVLIRMPDHDITVKAKKKYIGKDVLLGKPATASNEIDDSAAGRALDGKTSTRWFAHRDDGDLWLEVDAGKEYTVNKWLVMHGGAFEADYQTARDFRLQYRSREDEEWRDADVVTGNTQWLTMREFPEVTARYFRYYADYPTQGGWLWARVHVLSVYEKQ